MRTSRGDGDTLVQPLDYRTCWSMLSLFMGLIVRTKRGRRQQETLLINRLLSIVVAMKTKGTGRPKKAPDAVKADYIEVRCEQSEKEAFRSAAEAAGLPLSAGFANGCGGRREGT